MSHSLQHQEYSARYGLKNALNDIEVAQQIAEAKYRALVGREIFISEITDIHQLIEELRNWVVAPKTLTESLTETSAAH